MRHHNAMKRNYPVQLVRPMLLLCSCLLVAGVCTAQTAAGVVKRTEGAVEIWRAGKPIAVTIGTPLQAGDLIKTSHDSGLGLILRDETRMAVGANSQVALEQYSFDASTFSGGLLVHVVQGKFAMVPGLVVQHNPASSQVKTPGAVAAIAGGSFTVEVP